MDLSIYPPALRDLLANRPVQPLGPGQPHKEKGDPLSALALPAAFAPHPVNDPDMAQACLAGLFLAYDFLDQSHAISQDLNTPEGSYWHAIMHRREPDAWNSKYWFRKVGSHPVLERLAEEAPTLGYQFADPFAFVDFAERVRGSETAEEELAKRVQLLEWQLLFDHCYRKAVGA